MPKDAPRHRDLIVTIRVRVRDLTRDEYDEEDFDGLTFLDDVSAGQIGSLFDGGITPAGPHGLASPGANGMLFEGAELGVVFEEAETIQTRWIEDPLPLYRVLGSPPTETTT